jgi:hypothetical protein
VFIEVNRAISANPLPSHVTLPVHLNIISDSENNLDIFDARKIINADQK